MENVIENISRNSDGVFPKKELEMIIENQEEYIPALLHIVKDIPVNYDYYIREKDYIAHIYAIHLLTQFRVKELYSIFYDILKLPHHAVDYILGDFLTESGARVFTALYEDENDLVMLQDIIENREIEHDFVSTEAIEAIVSLTHNSTLNREDVIDYFEQLVKGILHKSEYTIRDGHLVTWLIYGLLDLYPDRSYDLIKQAFDKGLVDEFVFNLTDVDRVLAIGKEEALAARKNRRRGPIDDTIKEMQGWAAFKQERFGSRPKTKKRTKRNRKKGKK